MALPKTPTFRLDGKTALITGASSGIGRAAAVALAEAGAHVTVAARRADALDQLVGELQDAGHSARAQVMDVANIPETQQLVSELGLLSKSYLASRAQMIDLNEGLQTPVDAGIPEGLSSQWYPDNRDGLPGTSHVSIHDQYGNAVSLTTTIESGFGSGLFVRGFLLNNELTDFSFTPFADGKQVANRVQAQKRPRSSMAPVIIYGPEGELRFILGSPGGSRIINYVAQTIIGLIDFDLSPQDAVDLGKISSRNGTVDLEKNTAMAGLKSYLEAKGNRVKLRDHRNTSAFSLPIARGISSFRA